jgi:predicted MPP superfamily phosphohydrolase
VSASFLHRPLTRRHWLTHALWAAPTAVAADAAWLEPGWLAVRHRQLSPAPRTRFVHFTDVHHKGDDDRLRRVVDVINGLKPDFACFTGDLIEEAAFLAPALVHLARIQCPLFGIPGNHDHWSGANFAPAREVFAATGGGWLMDETRTTAGGRVRIIALDRSQAPLRPQPGVFNLVLMHYPAWADELPYRADLLLAGHSHGGQVRLPWIGALVKPEETGRYEMGAYDSPAGPVYVNPGIGTFYLDVRFNCRPEVTVFEV